jgi:hypothetical protein
MTFSAVHRPAAISTGRGDRGQLWVNGGGRWAGRERQPHPSKPTTFHSKLIVSCVPSTDIPGDRRSAPRD